MDFKKRDSNWLERLNEVFKDDAGVENTVVDVNVKEQVSKLKGLLHKRTRLWWNRAFLNKYLERGLIPRGLRIQIFPAFPVEEEDFKSSWEDLATKCSRGFIELLMKLDDKKLTGLESDIENIQSDLKKHLTPASIEKMNIDLDADFKKWENEICKIKMKKLQRDTEDFKSHRAYRWRVPKQRRTYQTRSRSGSMSSFTSNETNHSHARSHWDSDFSRRKRGGEPNPQKRKRISPQESGDKGHRNNLE